MTKEELDAMQARADAATKGPWVTVVDSIETEWERSPHGPDRIVDRFADTRDSDLSFIANARVDVPRLIAAVLELQATVERQAAELLAVDTSLGLPTMSERRSRGQIVAALREAIDEASRMGADGRSENGCPACLGRDDYTIAMASAGEHLPGCFIGAALAHGKARVQERETGAAPAPGRLDADRAAKPLTEIVPVLSPNESGECRGEADRAERYVVRPTRDAAVVLREDFAPNVAAGQATMADRESILAWLRCKRYRLVHTDHPARKLAERLVAEGRARWMGGDRCEAVEDETHG